MTKDPRITPIEAFGRLVTGQRRLAQRRLRESSARYPQLLVVVSRPSLDKQGVVRV